jgi:hypothetical protein
MKGRNWFLNTKLNFMLQKAKAVFLTMRCVTVTALPWLLCKMKRLRVLCHLVTMVTTKGVKFMCSLSPRYLDYCERCEVCALFAISLT